VLLFELASGGQVPYANMFDSAIQNTISSGSTKLVLPDNIPLDSGLRRVFEACQIYDANNRPNIFEVLDMLKVAHIQLSNEQNKSNVYVELGDRNH